MKKRVSKRQIFNLIDRDTVSSQSAQAIKDYIDHLIQTRNNSYFATPHNK